MARSPEDSAPPAADSHEDFSRRLACARRRAMVDGLRRIHPGVAFLGLVTALALVWTAGRMMAAMRPPAIVEGHMAGVFAPPLRVVDPSRPSVHVELEDGRTANIQLPRGVPYRDHALVRLQVEPARPRRPESYRFKAYVEPETAG